MPDCKICGIYKITSPTGKIYIGKSVDIIRRCKRYKFYDCKNQSRLYRSLIKYTWESHVLDVIEECSKEDLSCRERYWQDFYNAIGENGLNCTLEACEDKLKVYSDYTISKIKESAKNKEPLSKDVRKKIGESNKGKKHTEDVKKRMSESKKGMYDGEKNPNYGKKRSVETNDKINKSRRSMKGENNPNYGKPMTQEQKDKISKTHIEKEINKGKNNPNFGKVCSDKTKKLIGKANKGKRTFSESPHAKQVLDTQDEKIYGSIRELIEVLGITRSKFKTLVEGVNPIFIRL